MTQEIWKDVIGYEGFYQVSNLGNIKRIKAYESRRIGNLSMCRLKNGYLQVSLWKLNGGKSFYVHDLACSAFHGKRPDGTWCNHKDGNKFNNSETNLEWVTPYENEHHAFEHLGKSNAGERNGRSKLVKEQVVEIRKLFDAGLYSHQAIADLFGVSRRQIHTIIARKQWKHI